MEYGFISGHKRWSAKPAFATSCPVDAITVVFPEQMLRSKTDVVTLPGKVAE